ncbi:MAG TPA: diguanylate cyclase [Symbiobacteriaceae bacterium]
MEQILIVDDMPTNIRILGELLKDRYEILVANNGNRAVQIAQAKRPDLILMDVMMPEMDGFAACRALKLTALTTNIPVIFITARHETDDVVKGFESGGVDYITKPFNPAELYARVKTHIDLKNSRAELARYAMQMAELNRELQSLNIQLNEANANLSLAAWTDPLTMLANRRTMVERIREEAARTDRTQGLFSLCISDLDHFKKINDTYGHDAGDHVLKSIASILKSALREQDVLARWGGEEFLLLMPETGLKEAQIAAERLRGVVENAEILYDGNRIALTMTFGVSTYDKSEGVDGSIKKADSALYVGKSTGRNCVVAEPPHQRAGS